MRTLLMRQFLAAAAALVAVLGPGAHAQNAQTHADLVRLFGEWRDFQQPRMVNGVPDYSPPAMRRQRQALKAWQNRLASFALTGWSIAQQVDYHLVRAEMNGLEFDHRVMRPWSRNPSFYNTVFDAESDTPLHEGSHAYGALELWQYRFPLSARDAGEIQAKLDAVPRLLNQARTNLTEDAKDLWTIGIRSKKEESSVLAALAQRVAGSHPALAQTAAKAQAAVDEFTAWMEARQKTTKGPSGIGVEHYNWYLKNVHLSPYTWQQLHQMMERELYRTLATLRLEQQRNRKLPELTLPATGEELEARNTQAIDFFMKFLREEEIFSVPDYMNLDRLRGSRRLVPQASLDIFSNVEYRDSLPMKTHSVHWLEKQRLDREPHPSVIRSVRPLYNIWDARSEGFATAFEELMMNAGLFDGRPRARELIYIMGAVRAVRGLADLEFHRGRFTLEQAMQFIVEKSPNRWFNPDGDTIWVDMGIYATQPSYGTTYLAGKVQFDRLLANKSVQVGARFRLKDFMDEFFAKGVIPITLIRWEMTGLDDEMSELGFRHH